MTVTPVLACLLVILTTAALPSVGITPTKEELAVSHGWANDLLTWDQGKLPFSFHYGGRASRQFLESCRVKITRRSLDKSRSQITITWTDPATGLVVRCVAVEYRDFPTLEWTLYFKNSGKADTPILENILPLDEWAGPGRDNDRCVLHHNTGSPANRSDYAPLETVLAPGTSKRISAAGGRPTNSDLSYFNLSLGKRNEGMIVAVGWPGQWSAEFARNEWPGDIHVSAGQELTHFTLHPGEEVRTPLIVLQAWRSASGDWLRGQNLWRRWMMAHSMPKPGGKLPPPLLV